MSKFRGHVAALIVGLGALAAVGCGDGSGMSADAGSGGSGGASDAHMAQGAAGMAPGSGGQGSGGQGSGGMPAPVKPPAELCDDTTPALGSCNSGDVCQDSSDPAGWSIIKATCVLPGDELREGLPCSDYRLSGRCYRENGGYPVFTFTYGGRSSTASVERGCQEADARFCPNLPGVTDQDYESCKTLCAAMAPDLSRAPECELDFDCPDDCVRAAVGASSACANCIHQALNWPPSGCGERECQCNPPFFPQPTDPVCKDACSQ